jgi:hypothetical protein
MASHVINKKKKNRQSLSLIMPALAPLGIIKNNIRMKKEKSKIESVTTKLLNNNDRKLVFSVWVPTILFNLVIIENRNIAP